MPEKETMERVERDKEEGKSASTQAGEFIREEMHHIREGKHGARSPQQAIAIGLSKARRAGVDLQAPPVGKVSPEVHERAERDIREGRSGATDRPSPRRSHAVAKALKREGRSAASAASLSRHAHESSERRGKPARQESARRAVQTKRHEGITRGARKGAHSTRARRRNSKPDEE
jgi:hypothetical protein